MARRIDSELRTINFDLRTMTLVLRTINCVLRTIDFVLRTLNVVLRKSGGEHAGSYDMWHAEKRDDDDDETTTRQRDINFRRWFTPLNPPHMYNINRSGTPLT